MKKAANILLSFLLLGLFGAGVYRVFLSHGDDVIIPVLSPRGGESDSSEEYLRTRTTADSCREEIARRPDIVGPYTGLTGLFLREARLTGHQTEYTSKALAVMDECDRRNPGDPRASAARAEILLMMGRFPEAERLASEALTRDPGSETARRVLCQACLEMGNDQAADSLCSSPGSVPLFICAARVREHRGDFDGARALLTGAVSSGERTREERSALLCELGMMSLEAGMIDTAEALFITVLANLPSDPAGLSGLALVRQCRRQYQDGASLLGRACERVPVPSCMEQLADLYLAAGQEESAQASAKIAAAELLKMEGAGWNVNCEYARLCANHDLDLPGALERGRRESEIRPANPSVLDAYAWVLYKSGRVKDAVPLIERAVQLRSSSFLLQAHAGAIYASAGDEKRAKMARGRSLELNKFADAVVLFRKTPVSPVNHQQ